MTNLRKAAQMALDALELVDGYVMGKDEAKEALYEALERPEPEPVALSVRFPRHAPKHGEDWIIDPSFLLRIYHSIDPDAHYGFIPTMEEIETALLALEVIPSKLYTTPPQQPEPPCKTGSQCVGGKCERCAAQEPWRYISHRSWKMPVFVEAGDLEVSGLPFNNPDYTPVYKAPPQREWQGLTDEETADLIWKSDYEPRQIAIAIEAALRSKNT